MPLGPAFPFPPFPPQPSTQKPGGIACTPNEWPSRLYIFTTLPCQSMHSHVAYDKDMTQEGVAVKVRDCDLPCCHRVQLESLQVQPRPRRRLHSENGSFLPIDSKRNRQTKSAFPGWKDVARVISGTWGMDLIGMTHFDCLHKSGRSSSLRLLGVPRGGLELGGGPLWSAPIRLCPVSHSGKGRAPRRFVVSPSPLPQPTSHSQS